MTDRDIVIQSIIDHMHMDESFMRHGAAHFIADWTEKDIQDWVTNPDEDGA